MRVLVTGAAGFIGSRVVQQLAGREGVTPIALVKKSSDLWRLRACGVGPEKGKVQLVHADLRDPDAVPQALAQTRPEVIVHLAMAYHTLGSAGGKDVDAVNFHATLGLHRAFADCGGRRFVGAGTCFEYGHQDAEFIDESAPCQPIYDYAIAKARATEALLEQGQHVNVETLVLRVFAPYGPLEDPRRIVPELFRAATTGRRLELSPGEQVRDYVHVHDVAAAFVAAALRPVLATNQAVYNVCSAAGYSLRQLATVVARVFARPLDLHWGKLPYRPNEMMRLVGDNRRIRRDLGWHPSYPLAEGLAQTARWLMTTGQDTQAA